MQLAKMDYRHDEIQRIAQSNWGSSQKRGVRSDTFNNGLVEALYQRCFSGSPAHGRRRPGQASFPLQELEISSYLEAYLWPHFTARSSFEHVMSILMMINEKRRENLPLWDFLSASSDSDAVKRFEQFFCRALLLRNDRLLSVHERLAYLAFLVNVFQSLENDSVRTCALRLVSLPLWLSVSPSRVELELFRRPALKRAWARVRKDAADDTAGASVADGGFEQPGSKRKRPVDESMDAVPFPVDAPGLRRLQKHLDSTFLPSLLAEFFALMDSIPPAPAPMHAGTVQLCEAFLSWVVDLLVQLPTRRFTVLLLADCHFLLRCSLSNLKARAPEAPTIYSAALRAAQSLDASGAPAAHIIDETSAGARSAAGILGGSVLPQRKLGHVLVQEVSGDSVDLIGPGSSADGVPEEEEGSDASVAVPSLSTGRLFSQLLDMLRFYIGFEVDEHNGQPLTEREAEDAHAARVGTLQRVAFRLFAANVPAMREFALAATGVATHPRTLRSYLGVLTDPQLIGLARNLRLIPGKGEGLYAAPTTAAGLDSALQAVSTESRVSLPGPHLSRDFITDAIVEVYTKRPSAVHAVNALPLLPPESLLWDANLVPAGNRYIGDAGSVLALPKAGLQYLSLYDYLSRHFHLLRLESAYGVRLDLVDAIRRMGGRMSLAQQRGGYPTATPTFTGWARMCACIDGFSVREVGPPRVGFEVPSHVGGEVRLNLSKVAASSRMEWDGLREHDVLFLVNVKPIVPVGRHPDELRDPKLLRVFTAAAAAGPAALAALASGGSAQGPGKAASHDRERPTPDEEDFTFPLRYGIVSVRGCEVTEILDEAGDTWGEFSGGASGERDRDKPRKMAPSGVRRTLRVSLDPGQYHMDVGEARRVKEKEVRETVGKGAGQAKISAEVPLTMAVPLLYEGFNLLVRRDPRSNNFRAVLETVRDLMNVVTEAPDTASGLTAGGAVVAGGGSAVLPSWFQDIFLGYGDPAAAHYRSRPTAQQSTDIDFRDTFLSGAHVAESFPGRTVVFREESSGRELSPSEAHPPFRLIFQPAEGGSGSDKGDSTQQENVLALPYRPAPPGPYPEDAPRPNTVRFTPTQVEAIRSGLNPGLTMVVGPPGTGKTDTAVQVVTNLYHAFPTQRILLVAHSNQALNDLFVKILGRDILPHHLLRLGQGERELGQLTDADFSKAGRIAAALERRHTSLAEVVRLGVSIGAQGDVGYTCETAGYFHAAHVAQRIAAFRARFGLPPPPPSFLPSSLLPGAALALGLTPEAYTTLSTAHGARTPAEAAAQRQEYTLKLEQALQIVPPAAIAAAFPFTGFFMTAPGGLTALFGGQNAVTDVHAAEACFTHLERLFDEAASYRPLEILRSQRARMDYLLQHQARIVACTVTHAAIHRRRLVDLGFRYDTVVMEEAGQVAEVESLIPLVCQGPAVDPSTGMAKPRLQRIILIGDHNQLPPIVQNLALAGYAHLDQSLFARLVRLGVPTVQLDMQGRARPDIAQLYAWRYSGRGLGNLPAVVSGPEYVHSNGGMAHSCQLVDVPDYEGRGESTPQPHFYQNLGEAEYMVATFQYLRLSGWPASSIAMLTTYNGQKNLLRDVVRKRCSPFPDLFGEPRAIETVDKFQGQQADIVLLSLVRTRAVGHFRDVRRLVVALSRARLGLYVFARADLFSAVHELEPAFKVLCSKPTLLQLVVGESQPTHRMASDDPAAWAAHANGAGAAQGPALVQVEGVLHLGSVVAHMVGQAHARAAHGAHLAYAEAVAQAQAHGEEEDARPAAAELAADASDDE